MLSNALTLFFSSVHGKHAARGASSQQQQMQTPPENLPFWMLILQGQCKRIRVCFLKHTKQPLNKNQSIAPTLERFGAREVKYKSRSTIDTLKHYPDLICLSLAQS